MGDKTSISWTDATWNPIRGCRRVSPGCENCYAERQANRFAGKGGAYDGLVKITANGPRWTGKTMVAENHLRDPMHWKKPRRIFTDSMSDLFYDGVHEHTIDRIVAVMVVCCEDDRGHVFQTLTKRAERMSAYLSDPETVRRVASAAGNMMVDGDRWYDDIVARGNLVYPGMWWGVSVENQAAADERIPELLETPAAIRFLSCEPLIGPVDISEYFDPCSVPCGEDPWPHLDWVIAGCESGPGARPCEASWLRSLRDQCAAAGVPFFLKQAVEGYLGVDHHGIANGLGSHRKSGGVIELPYLDGVQHKEFPCSI